MKELGLDPDVTNTWFDAEEHPGYVLLKLTANFEGLALADLGLALRRCYLADGTLSEVLRRGKHSQDEIVGSRLPGPGSVMSGDFAEILWFMRQSCPTRDGAPVGVLKWRLKQDFLKSAPHSDVLHVLLPNWPRPSERDMIFCAEVKAKATASKFDPINAAMEGSKSDRDGRLAKTLLWLRARNIIDPVGLTDEQLDRFLHPTEHSPTIKIYRAVAVVSEELLDAEIPKLPDRIPADTELVIVSVPALKDLYTRAYDRAAAAFLADGEAR